MNDWFEWNGVKCTEYGMHVLSLPSIVVPVERIEPIPIPGRAGTLTQLQGEDVYDDITLTCSCVIDDPYDLSESRIANIAGWLRGEGNITFANRQEGFHKGRIANQIGFDKIVRGNPHLAFQIQFRCKPFFYLKSGLIAETAASSPKRLNNPGNIASRPLLRVVGSDEGVIVLGGKMLLINDISDIPYMMIDCDAKLAYRGVAGDPLDPPVLLGTRISGDWPIIPVGASYLVYSGGISSIDITPRWMRI